jgi:hypothetical protein
MPIDMSNNAIGLYARAESLIYIYNLPDSAIAIFDYLVDNFPDLAPKASFAKAWTLDMIIGVTDSSAFYAYADVQSNYPETDFAKAAKNRTNPQIKQRKKPERREAEEEIKEGETLTEAQVDSLRMIAQNLPEAPPVLELGEFLYPEVLLERDLRGEVLFKIRIDITGRVTDYELIGPSGEYTIDSVATVALLETEFDASELDFSQLDSFFRYAIPFERPELDLYNNPYRERNEQP